MAVGGKFSAGVLFVMQIIKYTSTAAVLNARISAMLVKLVVSRNVFVGHALDFTVGISKRTACCASAAPASRERTRETNDFIGLRFRGLNHQAGFPPQGRRAEGVGYIRFIVPPFGAKQRASGELRRGVPMRMSNVAVSRLATSERSGHSSM